VELIYEPPETTGAGAWVAGAGVAAGCWSPPPSSLDDWDALVALDAFDLLAALARAAPPRRCPWNACAASSENSPESVSAPASIQRLI
jgi:hypothetical protein